MRFFERNLTPEKQHFRFGLEYLTRIGLWGDRRRIFRYFMAVTMVLTVLVGPKAFLGPGKEGMDYFARNIAELIFLVENLISIGIFATRRKSLEQLVRVLGEILSREWPEDMQQEIYRFNKLMDRLGLVYAFYIYLLVVIFIAGPIASTTYQMICLKEEDRTDFMLVFEIQFYWLNVRHDVWHYSVFIIFCTLAVCCSAYQNIIKGAVFFVAIQYGSKIFGLLARRIAMTAKMPKVEDRHDELREIIELHKLILEYTEHLESMICFILLNQLLNCILIWCLMMFYISNNFGANAVNVITLFLVLMSELVIYCVNGEILSERASQIAEAMYSYPWYEDPILLQRTALLVIERAQKTTGITAAKFYFVNLERLIAVVQASYSYYLILKDNL
ncbi:odorant receptor 63a-like [Toxorhynchites rutilus septentrionalis]|uniref:odorant receptor 63a-like n=1 Tax=Toxorhynchites rutilus septentrionalis TaxID=329112 RepID=UPI00247B1DF1|nr:odorant receptor 63a-like [Toxorhynchites rutilus septentrionalis]